MVAAPADPAWFATEPGRPVVLVPGVDEPWRFLRPVAAALGERGYQVHLLPELDANRMPIERGAQLLLAHVAERTDVNARITGHHRPLTHPIGQAAIAAALAAK